MDNERIARDFFARWATSFDEMCSSFEDAFAPNCRWDQRPLAVTVGTPDAIKFLARSHKLMGLETIDVELFRCASSSDTFLCERVDHLRKRNGSLIASAAVVGVLSFNQGRIIDWREYYDAFDLIKQACVNLVRAPFSSQGRAR